MKFYGFLVNFNGYSQNWKEELTLPYRKTHGAQVNPYHDKDTVRVFHAMEYRNIHNTLLENE